MRYLTTFFCVVWLGACSFGTTHSPPSSDGVPMPDGWAFLSESPVEHVVNATDTYVSVTTGGGVESLVVGATTGAAAQGWSERSRSEVFGGTTIDFEKADGSLLTITVVPEGSSFNLSATRVPPE